MLIKSIKSKDNKITVKYVNENSNGLDDEMTICSRDFPRPEFYQAFAKLLEIVHRTAPDLIQYPWILLPEEILFKHENGKDGEPFIDGIFIVGKIHSKDCISLQVKTDKIYKRALDDDVMFIINEILDETRLFVKGYRAQDKLFDEPAESKAS